MKKEVITHSVKEYNEDQYLLLDNAALVIDGASGLGRKILKAPMSDAAWLTQKFCSYFSHHYNDKLNLNTLVENALEDIKKDYRDNLKFLDFERFEIPSFSFIFCQSTDDAIYIHSIGDCKALCEHRDGGYELVGESSLEALDEQVIQLISDLPKSLNAAEKRAKLLPKLRENRSLMNRHDGYAIVNPVDFSTSSISVKRFEKRFLKQVILMTDGFYAACNPYHELSFQQLLDMVNQHGLPSALEYSRRIENDDRTLCKHPRFKISDDATAVRLFLQARSSAREGG
ncbi:MAG: hypothetical protein CL547_01235 [Alcanivorax sp.]|nr:hypothetical protein [Alcanivorax sp.]|tara:strand:+ start:1288 stop:2145 length:858 start_codon:yes stop_codon:yes gene_type:complete